MSDPPKPQTTMGRIAALEARQAELEARLDKFERETLGALSFGDPPKRDPASTVTCGAVIRSTPNHGPAAVTAPGFGFGKETA